MVEHSRQFCQRLGIAHPIVQAPMAGGVCTPALVAAVSGAGGLGSFGFAYSTPERIQQDIQSLRAIAAVPFNANLFVFPPAEDVTAAEPALRALAECPLVDSLSVSPVRSVPEGPHHPDFGAQLAAVCAERPDAVTFHFGLPDAASLEQVRRSGAAIGCTATSVNDAMLLEEAGVDFIVAQGAEAGGHRGTRTPAADAHPAGTLALVLEATTRVSVPVIAAGGLMNGEDLAAAQRLGAAGGQFGTAFLTTDESGHAALYRDAVQRFADRKTVFTRGFSGRLARGISNRFTDYMADAETLPFPHQNTLTGPLRAAARAQGELEAQSLWAGTGFKRARSMPAAALVQALVSECVSAQACLEVERAT